MKKWILNNWIKLLIIIVIVLALCVGIYLWKIKTKTHTLPETQAFCDLGALSQFRRNWIRACYIENNMTPECENLFDSNGYYLPLKNAPTSIGEKQLGVLFDQYDSDMTICACSLPNDVAQQIDEQYAEATSSCSQYPETLNNSQGN
jgi:hypothetical protein